MNELVQTFNQLGQSLSAMTLKEILTHDDGNIYYGVCSIWLIDHKGRILCSKRSDNSLLDPGCWQSFFGGKLRAQETHDEAAMRELEEETGLKTQNSNIITIDSGFIPSVRRYYKTYAVLFDSKHQTIIPNPQEISEVRWLTIEEYNRESTNYPKQWCGHFNLTQQDKVRGLRKIQDSNNIYFSVLGTISRKFVQALMNF